MDHLDKLAREMEEKLEREYEYKGIKSPSENYTSIPAGEFISDDEQRIRRFEKKQVEEPVRLSQHDILKYGFNFPYSKRINN